MLSVSVWLERDGFELGDQRDERVVFHSTKLCYSYDNIEYRRCDARFTFYGAVSGSTYAAHVARASMRTGYCVTYTSDHAFDAYFRPDTKLPSYAPRDGESPYVPPQPVVTETAGSAPTGFLYSIGPMWGRPGFGYPRFDALARHLRDLGCVVDSPCSPSARVREAAAKYSDDMPETCETLAVGTKRLADDAATREMLRGLVLLPGWAKSEGARRDVEVALSSPGCATFANAWFDDDGEVHTFAVTREFVEAAMARKS